LAHIHQITRRHIQEDLDLKMSWNAALSDMAQDIASCWVRYLWVL
jgi:hypothetical protein